MNEQKQVSQNEVALLVLRYLHKNGHLFPKSLEVFKRESQVLLCQSSIAKNLDNMQDLDIIVNDYVKLKSHNYQNTERKDDHSEQRTVFNAMERTLEGISQLVRDYRNIRDRPTKKQSKQDQQVKNADNSQNNSASSEVQSTNSLSVLCSRDMVSDQAPQVSTALTTPCRTEYTKPGIVTELMNRFSETSSDYKRKKRLRQKSNSIVETNSLEFDMNTCQKNHSLDQSRVRLPSFASSILSTSPTNNTSHNKRRRKKQNPRKLVTSKSANLSLPVFREPGGASDSILSGINIESENSRQKAGIRDAEDSQMSSISGLFCTGTNDGDSLLPPELGEKIMHDQSLHQRLADEINKNHRDTDRASVSVSEPVIDDILSNILGHLDSSIQHPRNRSSNVASEPVQVQEKVYIENIDDNIPEKKTNSKQGSKRNSKRAKKNTCAKTSQKRQSKQSTQSQEFLECEMDVDAFLNTIYGGTQG